jgi:outer membrane protein assembly factor BamB
LKTSANAPTLPKMSYRAVSNDPLISSSGNLVAAVDRATGRILWENKEHGGAAGGALLVTATRVYVAGWGAAGALDLETGATVWKAETGVGARPALMLDGDRLLVAGDGKVVCHGVDGSRLWFVGLAGGRSSVAIAIGERTAYDDREG